MFFLWFLVCATPCEASLWISNVLANSAGAKTGKVAVVLVSDAVLGCPWVRGRRAASIRVS